MRKSKLLIALAAAATVATIGGVGVAVADPADQPNAKSPIDEKLLSQQLDSLAEVSQTAVTAEVRDGDEVWTEARGTRADGGDEEAAPTDRARIASVTKSMVTTVVLQLVDDGELGLDDSIHDLMPGLLPYQEQITVRQLLGHTAGLPDYFIDIYPSLAEGSPADLEKNGLNEYTPTEIIDTATKRPLDFEPGSDYRYSNTGYYVIGLLVEDLTGNSVEREVANRVLEPADMDDTDLPRKDPTIDGDHLDAYIETGDTPGADRIDTSALSPTQLWAAGVAVANPSQMNKLFRAMFDGTLLPQELLDEARELSEQSKGAYGLGLEALPVECAAIPEGKALGHTGGGLGHTTFSFHSADAQSQVSFTFATDMQLLPLEEAKKISRAIMALTTAGLCGSEVSTSGDGSDLTPLDSTVFAQQP